MMSKREEIAKERQVKSIRGTIMSSARKDGWTDASSGNASS